jgi:hypothetical protein
LKTCICGCGHLIPDINKLGKVSTYKHGHNNRIKPYQPLKYDSYREYNGGIIVDKDGYVCIKTPNHARATKGHPYIYEHVLVMENHLERYLRDSELVHHIDGDKQNNRLKNLQLTTNSKHVSFHAKQRYDNCKHELHGDRCKLCGSFIPGMKPWNKLD